MRPPWSLGAVALAFAAPSVALAQDGAHPFENCTEAYEAGYSNIPEGDEHYGDHLDRDQDGVGCDNPPSDFVPADHDTTSENTAPEQSTDQQASGQDNPDLAETGGSSATPYYAAGGAVVLLAGAGVLVATRKRRANN